MRAAHRLMPRRALGKDNLRPKTQQAGAFGVDHSDARRSAMPDNWRDDRAYDHFDTLGLSGLAWECLRRNAGYRSAYRGLLAEGGGAADWGLRFRGRP